MNGVGDDVIFCTTRETIRIHNKHPHVTIGLACNAAGDLAPPFVIYKGDDASAIPLAALNASENDLWIGVQKNGCIDEANFERWVGLFVVYLKENYPTYKEHLLIMDGHATRFNMKAICTFATNGIRVILGPSHLTNSWQPADQFLNKV